MYLYHLLVTVLGCMPCNSNSWTNGSDGLHIAPYNPLYSLGWARSIRLYFLSLAHGTPKAKKSKPKTQKHRIVDHDVEDWFVNIRL